jgi:hypothetical protein
MATQYSILSVLIRPEIQEKITIGFLLIDDNNVFFEYSKNKLSVAKTLLSDNAYKSLKDALHNVQATAEMQHSKQAPADLGFDKLNTFTKSYIEYLSRYNNNILSFTSPKNIELQASLDVFTTLYRKFIDGTILSHKEPFINSIEQFKTKKLPILTKHFNIDKEITHNELPNLIVPVTVTFIGQNEVPTFVQSLDLEKRTDFLINDISEILFLQKAFKEMEKESVAMSITSEPNKKEFPKQHDIWNQLRITKGIKNYDISEADAVIEYAEEHNVLPYIAVTEPF